MKLLQAITLASFLFASCTKEGVLPSLPSKSHPNSLKVAMTFSEISGANTATIAIENKDAITGEWDWDGDFTTDTQPNNLKLFFYDWGNDPENVYPVGIITIATQLSQGNLNLNTYTGKGKWTLSDATGTFAAIKQGSGALTWSEIDQKTYLDHLVNCDGYVNK